MSKLKLLGALLLTVGGTTQLLYAEHTIRNYQF